MNFSPIADVKGTMRLARRGRTVAIMAIVALAARAHTLPVATGVEVQPLIAHVKRVLATLDSISAPIDAEEMQSLEAAFVVSDAEKSSAAIQHALDHRCLFLVRIEANARVLLVRGIARPELVAGGSRAFLVKVVNEAGATAPLRLDLSAARGEGEPWLDATLVAKQPETDALTGERLEYRILRLESRESGKRVASFGFYLGQEKPQREAMMRVSMLFNSLPAQ
jgi:hypothetical protein